MSRRRPHPKQPQCEAPKRESGHDRLADAAIRGTIAGAVRALVQWLIDYLMHTR